MKKEKKQEIIKKRIVDAIFYYLPHMKIEDMTSDEIAKRAEVSKRTLYKYFSSKKEMYLEVVKESFMDFSAQIENTLVKESSSNILGQITSMGRQYLKYCFSHPIKADLILNYNEMAFIDEFGERVEEIQRYSNKFELTPFVRKYYEQKKTNPKVSVEAISLYLWAQVQGMASIMQSKREWIKEYYKIDEDKLIEEHMELSKKVLGEMK